MLHVNYQPETPKRIAETQRPCTPNEVQTYLELCLEISAGQPAHNVLEFPYNFMVNPYAVFYHWLEAINFQITPTLTPVEIERLRRFAKISVKEFRQSGLSSVTIFSDTPLPPETNHPFLRNFSQIYAMHQLFDSLYVYNFFLENYIHETHRLRTAIRADVQSLTHHWGKRWHHRWAKLCPAAREYNYWVRSFLLHESVEDGKAPFAQYMHHNFHHNFQGHHPILQAADRTQAVEAFLENQQLAHELRHYRYYHFLQPTPDETQFFHELRNDHGDLTHHELLGAGPAKLQQAVNLAGRLSQHVTQLTTHRANH